MIVTPTTNPRNEKVQRKGVSWGRYEQVLLRVLARHPEMQKLQGNPGLIMKASYDQTPEEFIRLMQEAHDLHVQARATEMRKRVAESASGPRDGGDGAAVDDKAGGGEGGNGMTAAADERAGDTGLSTHVHASSGQLNEYSAAQGSSFGRRAQGERVNSLTDEHFHS